MACSRIKEMQGADPEGIARSSSHLESRISLTANSMGLEEILCNSGVKVIVQLLAIKEKIRHTHAHSCIYDSSKNSPVCEINPMQFAHLHVTTKNPSAFIKHFILAFVKGTQSEKYDEIVNILYSTVKHLNIQDEKPHFYIFFYGNRPAINMSLSEGRNVITKELKKRITNYDKGEPICYTSDMERNAKMLVIHQNNKSTPYEFTFSHVKERPI